MKDKMDSFYILSQPMIGPEPPKYWSYSLLNEWRSCPKRWWLTHAKYDTFQGNYPKRIFPRTLYGLILHRTLEKYNSFLCNNKDNHFPVRNTIQLELRTFFEENAQNPRINKSILKPGFSVDDCINSFKYIKSIMGEGYFSSYRVQKNKNNSESGVPFKGHEITIYADSPPILGRLDLIDGGRIVEIKTGEPESTHQDQLKFYGLLYWLRTGQIPLSLELVYSKTNSVIRIEANAECLENLKCRLTEEIKNINNRISSGLVEPNINAIQCMYCPCRQSCEEYWQYIYTSNPLQKTDSIKGGLLTDVEIKRLPKEWPAAGSFTGKGESSWGDIYINIEKDKCPDEINKKYPQSARILGAILSYEKNHWSLRTGSFTEVFWGY